MLYLEAPAILLAPKRARDTGAQTCMQLHPAFEKLAPELPLGLSSEQEMIVLAEKFWSGQIRFLNDTVGSLPVPRINDVKVRTLVLVRLVLFECTYD
jgi:hypothetical protein